MSGLWCSRMLSQIGMTPDDYQQLLAEKDSLSVELEKMSALMQVDQCNIGIKSNHKILGQGVCTSFLGWGVGSLGPDWTIEINSIFPNCWIRWSKCEANGAFILEDKWNFCPNVACWQRKNAAHDCTSLLTQGKMICHIEKEIHQAER